MVAVTRLIAYAINDDMRWRRFLFLVLLLLAITVGWWLSPMACRSSYTTSAAASSCLSALLAPR